jgi:hypothetical protein
MTIALSRNFLNEFPQTLVSDLVRQKQTCASFGFMRIPIRVAFGATSC